MKHIKTLLIGLKFIGLVTMRLTQKLGTFAICMALAICTVRTCLYGIERIIGSEDPLIVIKIIDYIGTLLGILGIAYEIGLDEQKRNMENKTGV